MRALRLLVPMVVLLGLTLACGLGGGTQEAPPAAQVPGGEEEVASPTEAVEPAGGEAEAEGEEELDLPSVTSGLQALDSYRAYFRMTVSEEVSSEGGDDAEQWAYEMDMEYVRDPFAQHVVMRGGAAEEGIEITQIGDQSYMVLGEGQCVSSSAEGEAMDAEMFKPDDVIGGLSRARRVRPDESVNGIRCRHYKFDESAVAWYGFGHAEGEVWVAVDGDYVVKYVLQAEGKDPASGKEGHLEWVYEIRDVNEPIVIEPPAGCGAAGSEFPIMPDAADVTTMGGMVTYTSPSSFDVVQAFYEEQMPADGWSDTGEGFSSEGSAMMSYSKEGRAVSIMLTEEDGKVSVLIMSQE